MAGAKHVVIQPLEPGAVRRYVRARFPGPGESVERRWRPLLAAVERGEQVARFMRNPMRSWALNRQCDKTLAELSEWANPIVEGWLTYYGHFYRSELYQSLSLLNGHLARWAKRKYRRLRQHYRRARTLLANVAKREPNLFAHWRHGLRPSAG